MIIDNLLLSTEVNDTQNHCIILKNSSLNDFFYELENSPRYEAAFNKLLSLYRIKRDFPDMSHFRLGPNMFEEIPLYVIVLLNHDLKNNSSQLIAHGVMTDISWAKDSADLPDGWQGAVRRSYENFLTETQKNTFVGLYIRVENEFKQQGWSERIVSAMKTFASQQSHSLIIPLRLPQRYTEQYAKMPYKKFIALKREDGQYMDHWLRLHTRLGGSIIQICLTSHQHAMNLKDFVVQFTTKKIKRSGYYMAEKQGLWYYVYVDVKLQFALINQECTWVQHNTLSTP